MAPNKVIISNNTTRGAVKGIYGDNYTGDDYDIINNSFYDCDVGIDFVNSTLNNSKIANNIIHGNSGTTGITIQNASNTVITYNDVYDYTTSYGGVAAAGIGSISADPLYTDPDNGDLTLQEGSPCLDAGAGNGTYSEVPLDDYSDQSRPEDLVLYDNADDGTDMGAYELYLPPVSSISGGNSIDVTGGDATLISTISTSLAQVASVVADENFSSSDLWKQVIIEYRHSSGQKLRIVHTLKTGGWIGNGVLPLEANRGDWLKELVILIDKADDILIVKRDEMGSGEDLTITSDYPPLPIPILSGAAIFNHYFRMRTRMTGTYVGGGGGGG